MRQKTADAENFRIRCDKISNTLSQAENSILQLQNEKLDWRAQEDKLNVQIRHLKEFESVWKVSFRFVFYFFFFGGLSLYIRSKKIIILSCAIANLYFSFLFLYMMNYE